MSTSSRSKSWPCVRRYVMTEPIPTGRNFVTEPSRRLGLTNRMRMAGKTAPGVPGPGPVVSRGSPGARPGIGNFDGAIAKHLKVLERAGLIARPRCAAQAVQARPGTAQGDGYLDRTLPRAVGGELARRDRIGRGRLPGRRLVPLRV